MRRLSLVLAAVTMLALGTNVGAAGAATHTVYTVGTAKVVPNVSLMLTFHYSPGVVSVRSGDTLKGVDRSGAPHTISIVRPSQIPKTAAAMESCDQGICGQFEQGHAPHGEAGPFVPIINVGPAGLNQPGDSMLIPPHGSNSAKVTAPAHTTLYFFCAFHPWMQGRIIVT